MDPNEMAHNEFSFLLSPLLLSPRHIFFSELDSVSKHTRELKIRVVWFVF